MAQILHVLSRRMTPENKILMKTEIIHTFFDFLMNEWMNNWMNRKITKESLNKISNKKNHDMAHIPFFIFLNINLLNKHFNFGYSFTHLLLFSLFVVIQFLQNLLFLLYCYCCFSVFIFLFGFSVFTLWNFLLYWLL